MRNAPLVSVNPTSGAHRAQRLMWPLCVVVLDPAIDYSPGLAQRLEAMEPDALFKGQEQGTQGGTERGPVAGLYTNNTQAHAR